VTTDPGVNIWVIPGKKTFDSDYNFDTARHSKYGPNIVQSSSGLQDSLPTNPNRTRSAHLPNPSALNPKEFRRLLAKLRRARPRFKAMLDSKIEQVSNSRAHRFRHATMNPFNVHESLFDLAFKFLNEEAGRPFLDFRTRKLLPNPHHNASLSYAHSSDLTDQFLYKPVPGRIFSNVGVRNGRNTTRTFLAGVAGLVGRLNEMNSDQPQPTRLSDQAGHAIPVQFRAKHLKLLHAPRVVNAPDDSSGFKSSYVQLELVDDAKLKHAQLNSFLPGSQAYVAHDDPSGSTPKGVSKPMISQSQKRKGKPRSQRNLLEQNQRAKGRADEILTNTYNLSLEGGF